MFVTQFIFPDTGRFALVAQADVDRFVAGDGSQAAGARFVAHVGQDAAQSTAPAPCLSEIHLVPKNDEQADLPDAEQTAVTC